MGKPKFPRKKYETPLHPWKEDRIKSERELIKKYGLKNDKEVWKAKTYLKKYRGQARELLAKIGGGDPQVKKESNQLLSHLSRMAILSEGASLDDVLALETESILSRRLQTLVYQRGLATTIDHARQLISHGHIAMGGRKVTIPGYMVTKEEENQIGYTLGSPLNILSHPAKPKTDISDYGKKPIIKKKDEKEEKPKEKEQPSTPIEPIETTTEKEVEEKPTKKTEEGEDVSKEELEKAPSSDEKKEMESDESKKNRERR